MTQKARSAPATDPDRDGPPRDNPPRNPPGSKAFYLINENQSADLEEFRFALLGLADLAWDPGEAQKECVTVDRSYCRALVNQLEKRLREIIPPQRTGSLFLSPEQQRHAFRDARPLMPDQETPLY